MDPIAQWKENQKKGWAFFMPFETYTCGPAASLVAFANVKSGQTVLDVGCGTGVVAIAAARRGARVTGVDLTPELLAHAKDNASIAQTEIDWREGDAEAIPLGDASCDVVLSQFGHMFAPRPEVAVKEMLRVLKPGGTIAFNTWPPELYTGRMFQVMGRYLPPPPPGVSPPPQWGNVDTVRERLGTAVTHLTFDRGIMRGQYLSPQHVRSLMEKGVAPVIKVLETLKNDPEKLATFRKEIDALAVEYWDSSSNVLRQDYLMTKATKPS
jgi:ubiquinone/menaquinone biosynthesis C-methylase UbiE